MTVSYSYSLISVVYSDRKSLEPETSNKRRTPWWLWFAWSTYFPVFVDILLPLLPLKTNPYSIIVPLFSLYFIIRVII